jgi:hypothetical protein
MLVVLWIADTKDDARAGVGKIIYTALSGAQLRRDHHHARWPR